MRIRTFRHPWYNHLFSSDVYLKDLTYQTIYINGEIDGVKDLHIGSGVNLQLGEMVYIFNIYKIEK